MDGPVRTGECDPDDRIRGVSPVPWIELVLMELRHVVVVATLVEYWNLVGKIDEDFRITPIDARDPLRCNQDLFPWPRGPRVDDEETNLPRLVINDQILDVANFAVSVMDVTIPHVSGAVQMEFICRGRALGLGFHPIAVDWRRA